MANNNLERALDEALREIRRKLADKVRSRIETELAKVNKAKGLDKLMKRQQELHVLKAKVVEDIYAIEREIKEKEGVIIDALTEDERSVIDTYRGYGATSSVLDAVRRSLVTTDALNYLNFLKIEKNTQTMFSLAINQKEKRNIIFSLQSRNWKSLGIDMPQAPYLNEFKVENGIIQVPETVLIENK